MGKKQTKKIIYNLRDVIFDVNTQQLNNKPPAGVLTWLFWQREEARKKQLDSPAEYRVLRFGESPQKI